ncbi:biotin carboxylase N-terminal domain-containing protein [Nonomuraea sp. NPDC050328]|uniref:ATP-binding protein n=1 Tax=Nonomuraea sp. NPDC050328 TaxID=3364361 RepID=UPI0037B9371A
MITRVLVANRGEIARRVFRTCRELGISTVAVFSDADAGSPHVAEADQAVRLSGTAPAETYLAIPALLDACRTSGADAVHPGYGFLAESAAFAEAVLAEGLTWIGPGPEAIAAMGSKTEAKRLMAEAGAPVSATYLPGQQPPPEAFPLLVKAAAGGGGRGMRVVREPADLEREFASAAREALAAFGDGAVFAEPLLERARHVEVQVLADRHGTVWALGERDCSVQRRHQKVIEESPAPALAEGVRERLATAAREAARAIGYVGAGTLEFLVRGEDVAFLEMNTRLQVEHPVTELVHGVDLVRLQIEIAEGARLPAGPPPAAGHAIEARLYAEDRAYVPQTGTIHRFDLPGDVRVDSGVEPGSVVSPHYDPMLAKVVAHGASRTEALRKLTAALTGARLHGVLTNRDLLLDVLRNPDFVAARLHTSLIDETPASPARSPELAALAAALAMTAAHRAAATVQPALPAHWRNVRSQPATTRFVTAEGEELEVVHHPLPPEVTVISATPERVVLERDRLRLGFDVARYGDLVHVDSPLGALRLTELPRLPEPVVHLAPGSLLAPMPGTVLRVEVHPGDRVGAGQAVVVLEAMKMEHRITAPAAGLVAEVAVEKGRHVQAGTVLAIITEGDAA